VRSRITILLAACLLAVGFGSFLMANPASAQGTPQLCYLESFCLNAWNGGPYVNVYSPNVSNDAFQYIYIGFNTWVIQYEGSGRYSGDCIGDYNNDKYDARAGLYSNCTTGNVAWGAKFTVDSLDCPSNEVAFHNNHWGGYLAPAGFNNGDAFYLNSSIVCFTPSSFLGS
jgi:hypothetical protein